MSLEKFIADDGCVMVVDDVPSARHIVVRFLQQIGIRRILEAHDGSSALAQMKSEDVQLVISDWNMPGMDGIEFVAAMRVDPKLQKVPFVIITSSADSDELSAAFRAGATDYMLKPFNRTSISEKLQLLFEQLERKNP